MPEITISCEIIARMSHLLNRSDDPWARSLRLDGNCAIATERNYMAVQRIKDSVDQPVHLLFDEVLIEQCKTEAALSGQLHLMIEPSLGIATAKTTFGYVHTVNLLHNPGGVNCLDQWRTVINPVRPVNPVGSIMLDAAGLMMLLQTSPSGKIVFEETIDMSKPTILRDLIDPDWFGVFIPLDDKNPHDPATIPEWFK